MFSKYHYLSHELNPAADQYVAFVNNQPVAFCSVLHLPHGVVKNMKRISRIVTMPDYQGIGIGNALLNYVADLYKRKAYRVSITTTTPALIHSFQKSNRWRLTRQGRSSSGSEKSRIELSKRAKGTDSTNRITTSWEYHALELADRI